MRNIHLTDEGRALVEEWIKEETPAPTQKDEFLAKIYAFSTLDKTTATGLLFTREQQLNKIMQKNQKKLNDLSSYFLYYITVKFPRFTCAY